MIHLLRQPAFSAFLVANTLERFAASAMTVLLGFQVYAITHTALDLGWLGLAEAIPGLTLVLYGGHIADRHSRRRIVLVSTALLAALALVLTFMSGRGDAVALPAIFGVAFLSGVIRAFETPAATGLEAQVVPLAQLMRGVSLLASVGRIADLFGPIVGGFAWAWLGPRGTYGVIAALFACACAALYAGVGEGPALPPPRTDESTIQRIAEGIRFVFRDEILVGSMALDLFAVFFGGATALLPVFATDILHVGATGFGFLRAASGAGALLAAVIAGKYFPERRAGQALHWVIGGFGASIVIFGVSRWLPLSLAALFVAGLCDGTSVVIRRAIMRLASPEALRGRISAVRMIFIGSSNELGAFESGFAASLFGTPAAVWGGGVLTIAIVAFTAWRAPRLRGLDLTAMTDASAGAAESIR
jgi:MFS family permease